MNNFMVLARASITALSVIYITIGVAEALETSADKVSIDVAGGTQVLTGNVVVQHDGRIFKAQKIVIRQVGNSIQAIIATGGVSLRDGETIVTAEVCRYDAKLVTFSGDVVVQNGEIGTARADRATYNPATKKMDFTAKGKVELVLSSNKEARLFRGR